MYLKQVAFLICQSDQINTDLGIPYKRYRSLLPHW